MVVPHREEGAVDVNAETIVGWAAVAFRIWWVIEDPTSAAYRRPQHENLPAYGGKRDCAAFRVDLVRPGAVLSPLTQVPASVNRFLLPGESHVITVREHPAVLLPRTFLTLAGLAIAGWLSSSVAHGNNTAILVIWILWVILLLWLGMGVWEWAVHYFVTTSNRLMVAQGVITRQVNFIPLNRVTDVEFRRTPTGRLLGYGELEVMTPGQDEKMRHIRFLPYPEQIYYEVTGLMFQDTGRRCPQCAMSIPTAAKRCPHCTSQI